MDKIKNKLVPKERKLLIVDIYQRLGTGTLVQDIVHISNQPTSVWFVDTLRERVRLFADEPWIPIDTVRPYLRSMSSMTEEEKDEISELIEASIEIDSDGDITYLVGCVCIPCSDYQIYIDYLNSHHFDYRGLIEKGLALDAPENMYKI